MIYDGLRVLDHSTGLAGAYCAKLLTDLGADVVCVEDFAEVARLDRVARAHRDYLRTSQRSTKADTAPLWAADADIVITNTPMKYDGPLVEVRISAVGYGGPDDASNELGFTEEVLQARSGALAGHGHMSDRPLTVAGRIGEYVAGTFGALSAATIVPRARDRGVPEVLDISVLEAMHLTMLTVPTLFANFPGGAKHAFRFVMIPGNEPCGDGNYVGITTNTVAQWKALLHAAGRDDLVDEKDLYTMFGRFTRADDVNGLLHEWTGAHTADEIERACTEARVPVAVVGNGKLLLEFAHLRERDVFVAQPGEGFVRPRAPFRLHGVADRAMTAAPQPVADTESTWLGPRIAAAGTGPQVSSGVDAPRELPLSGVRVLDFTAFWAGPFATAWLAAMGADVIKVESIQRPDGIRFAASTRTGGDRDYEQSPLFASANLDKRGITLDLTCAEGVALAERLIATCDVVCENFTPRVMEDWGLDYERVRALRPDVVMLRLPAFGLSGPWRDRPGFAQTMEQLSGMAWATGYEDGPPIIAGGVVDPMVGAHAALAVVAAIEHRARTGEGQLVEVAMVDVAVATTAEQVLRYQLTGELGGRRGAHGVYRCADADNEWVAVAEERDPMTADDRAAWCATRECPAAAAELQAAGIPACPVTPGYATLDDPQLVARGFFELLDHSVVGEQLYPTWPVRFSAGPRTFWHRAAPLLGEHTDEVLSGDLGMTAAELDRLRAANVIGTKPL